MLQVGSVVGGKYHLLRSLGEGGMGAVWAARNELIGREVAIKVIQPHLAKNADCLHRFFNEARICASIRDPGIVDVLDMGTADDGSPFIVMELLEGEPLDALLDRTGGLPADIIVPIVRDVAQTLALAHEHSVVHRDLKPANIFLHRAGRDQRRVKILDFGVSKVVDEASPHATRTGAILGSPAYMSPEQASGTPVDHRSDIYSVGVILYEGLAGHIPFHDAPNTNALLLAIATKDAPSLAIAAPSTPPALLAIVARAMQRDRAQRFANATELASALDGVLTQLHSIIQDGARSSSGAIERPRSTDGSTLVSALGATMQHKPVRASFTERLPFSQPAAQLAVSDGFVAPSAAFTPPHARAPHVAGAGTAGPTSVTHPGHVQVSRGRAPLLALVLAVASVVGVVGLLTLVRTADAERSGPSAADDDVARPGAANEDAPSARDSETVATVTVEPTLAATSITSHSATPSIASSSAKTLTPTRPTVVRPPTLASPPPRTPSRKPDDFR